MPKLFLKYMSYNLSLVSSHISCLFMHWTVQNFQVFDAQFEKNVFLGFV